MGSPQPRTINNFVMYWYNFHQRLKIYVILCYFITFPTLQSKICLPIRYKFVYQSGKDPLLNKDWKSTWELNALKIKKKWNIYTKYKIVK